ncbi:MAG: Alpha-L-arabinofuranosidase precursor, partial [Phycisphaerales bacterium]|nr:Alpha-L-arabinofuranosidase precursor [Phycisphaerales bacterium]
AADAAKKLVWSFARGAGGGKFAGKLPEPPHKEPYYQDLFVLAYRPQSPPPPPDDRLIGLTASSAQPNNAAALAADGKPDTFWASGGTDPGAGPTREKPQWLRFDFKAAVTVDKLDLRSRPGYGPTAGEVQASDDGGKTFRPVKPFAAGANGDVSLSFPPTTATAFRVAFFGASDPRFPDRPRNVQVASVALAGPGGAWPAAAGPDRAKLQNYEFKAMLRTLNFSAPDTTPLLADAPDRPGEADVKSGDVVDLTGKLKPDGSLDWDAPAGDWELLRVGCTVGDHSRVSTSSDGWDGYALDVLDVPAFRRYWDAVVEPLVADAGPLAGKTLKYLHTDSWEVEAINWTPTLRDEFKKRRGYDLLPFLPVVAGRIVDGRDASNRFLHDFRKTLGDLAIDHHYVPFAEWSRKHGLSIHPESGGPHASPIDAQRALGADDAPMSEFWAESWRHRIGDPNRFFVKQPASAAHTYGKKLVLAEGFTTIGPHWQERVWDNLKPSFDKAATEGLNLLVWHAFVCSPQEEGVPGIQYFAGTHFNPNTTWWDQSGAFLAYVNRCQAMLQQGLFVADVAHYYGDHVPNFAQLRASDPAKVGPGYDYDVITEEALLTRAAVKDGRVVLPDGTNYRVLSLPDHPMISLPVLRKVKALVDAGATVVGRKPAGRASGLLDAAAADAEVKRLADELWGPGATTAPATGVSGAAKVGRSTGGKGTVFAGGTARDALSAVGVPPDFEFGGGEGNPEINYVHRRVGRSAGGGDPGATADVYFVANRSKAAQSVRATFRVAGRAPELWDAAVGTRRFAAAYAEAGGRTTVPLDLPPCGSVFVVFRAPAADHPPTAGRNSPTFDDRFPVAGPWAVTFDPKVAGPAAPVAFDKLVSWTTRPEPGVRFYSGTATYRTTFDVPPDAVTGGKPLWLDLGDVREMAAVTLNGKSLGVTWAPPFRVDATGALKPGPNALEVAVVNFWPNRIIGDASLPPEARVTRTNVRKLTKDTPLAESGLLGPVRLVGPQ